MDDVKIFGTVGQQIKDVVGTMRGMAGGRESMTVGVQMWFNTPAFLLNLFPTRQPQDQGRRHRPRHGRTAVGKGCRGSPARCGKRPESPPSA